MRLVFDIETNGLDWKASGFKVHCICTKDIETGEEKTFSNYDLRDGFEHLQKADLLIGHYIQFF
jgi:hypothetical protein